MSTTACARCQKQVPTDQLLPSGGKRICLPCEMEIEETRQMRGSVHRSIASPPVAALVTFLTLCIPYVGPFVSVILAVATVVTSIQGIRLGLSIQQDPKEYGVGRTEPVLLLVFSSLSGLAGLGLLAVNLVILVGVALVVLGR